MNELIVAIVGGLIVAIVSQYLAHYLALKREEKHLDEDCPDCQEEVKQGS